MNQQALVLVGWHSLAANAGEKCYDDIWISETDLAGTLKKSSVFKKPGNDVPFMLTKQGRNLRLVGYSKASENVQDNVYGLDVTFNRSRAIKILQQNFFSIKQRPRTFFNFVKPLANSSMSLAGGFVVQSIQAPPNAGLRLVGSEGQCGGVLVPRQNDYKYARVTSAAQLKKGSIIVSGRVWNSTKDSAGWLVWLSQRDIGNVDFGALSAGADLFDVNKIRSSKAALYKFSLTSASDVRFIARQVEGDVDVVLSARDGTIIRFSDNKNGATELIEARLDAGDYSLQIATAEASATFSLETRIWQQGTLQTAQPPARSSRLDAKLQTALHQLGYRVGEDADTAYGSRIKKAIKAFKASLCGSVDAHGLSKFQKIRLGALARTLSKKLASNNK